MAKVTGFYPDTTGHDDKQLDKGLLKPGSPLGLPPIQVMERSPDTSHYRIPSHVFATNKPSTPVADWSIASNESLFSIHNMSFTREEFNILLKSGDLGMYGDLIKTGELESIKEMYKSGELPPPLKDALKSLREQITPVLPQIQKSVEQNAPAVGHEVETEKDSPKLKVIDKKEAEASTEDLPCPATVCRDTEACAPSFAFQVSLCSNKSTMDKPREKGKEKDEMKGKDEAEDSSQLHQEKQPQLIEEEAKALEKPPSPPPRPPPRSSWLPCFFCCS